MVRFKGFQNLTTIDQASKKFLGAIEFPKPKTVTVPLSSALNRILAEKIIAKNNVPGFDRSAVDGYAVKADETIGGTPFKPKLFRVASGNNINDKTFKQVWTGNPIPSGSDAVVMIEDTKIVENGIEILCQVTPGENVSKTGEDIHKGEVAIDCPKRLKPQHLGLIAALGLTHVEVYQRPRVAVLATGNELTRQGENLEKGKIYETNSLFLNASTAELGAEPIELGIAKDDIDEISQKLKVGLNTADLILTSGGTSVGEPDFVPIAANRLGKPGVIVHGIAMRPGMPTALAVLNGKPILILPGNPVASMFGFEVFARPVLCMLLGLNHVERRPVVEARMTKSIPTALGRRSFVRVHVFKHENQLYAKPISARGSSMISTVTNANGYVTVPENREGLLEKDLVSVELFDALEE